MAGTVAPPLTAGAGVTVGSRQKMSASFANSFRLAAVAERLAMHVKPGSTSDAMEFFGLCLSLARQIYFDKYRGIDYAIANNEVPPKVHDLPLLLKQVCLRKNDLFLQASIMVLMVSVKNACNIGWFSEEDSRELCTLAKEIGNSFCSPGEINTIQNDSPSIIATITCRFYPLMKMGQILASLEVKPGYGAYVIDFHIAKSITHSPQEKIRLFVAQRDNIETSACIISPQQVNFLLNGKGVERRTNVSMDTGPQIPTNVTAMLKYGTNLLQAVGQFNGHYIIAVAFMSMTPLPQTPILLDYVQPNAAVIDPDSDLIEGPSRVSLNCPISYTRIRTPVKGQSCKHLQCFDFGNFVDINLRRPSWRCPHCNQHVCYTDIRVDQNMVKVLKEVGDNVVDVIISADGSWKVVLESDDNLDLTHKETPNFQKETPKQQEPSTSSIALPIVMDLTDDDDTMDVKTCDTEDRKPIQATTQVQSVSTGLTIPSQLNIANAVDQNVARQVADDFWPSVYFIHGSGTSSAGSVEQMVNGISASATTNIMTSPVVTDAVSAAFNSDVGGRGTNSFTSLMQNQISASGNVQLTQLVNSSVNNEYGRLTHIPRHVNRSPMAVQALPVPSQTSVQQQRSGANLNSANPSGSLLASQAALATTPTGNDFNTASNHIERQQQFQRSLTNPHQVLDMAPSSLQHHSTALNWNHQDRSSIPGQSLQQVALRTSSGLHNAYQNLHLQQALRIHQSRSQSPTIGRSSSAVPRGPAQQGVAQVGVGNMPGFQNRAVQMTRQPPSLPVQIPASRGTSNLNTDGTRTPTLVQRGNVGGAAHVHSGADMDLTSEQNWRPTGRMRGSLSGQAAAAYRDLIIQPSQPTQAPQPPVTSTSPSVPPHLQAFLSNNRKAYVPQTQNSSMTQPARMNGSSGTVP